MSVRFPAALRQTLARLATFYQGTPVPRSFSSRWRTCSTPRLPATGLPHMARATTNATSCYGVSRPICRSAIDYQKIDDNVDLTRADLIELQD